LLLGFTGNIFSLLTFPRVALRNVSTGCLFILLASSDTLYLLICVIDFVEFGLQVICSNLCLILLEYIIYRFGFIIVFHTMNSAVFEFLQFVWRNYFRHE
jgi:hypothetical protein